MCDTDPFAVEKAKERRKEIEHNERWDRNHRLDYRAYP